MSLRLALLAVVAFGLVVAYPASLNSAGVAVSIGADWTRELPVVALAAGAFLVGAALVLALGAVRNLTRRALRWSEDTEWPHRCSARGAAHAGWVDRCPSCRLWNTSRP